MPLAIATAHLSDAAFLAAVSSGALPLEQFRHGDHLRLAWLELQLRPYPNALEAVRAKIQRFAAHHGKANIFHETITTAWVALLATHEEPTFAEFVRANDERLNAALLHRFWSPEALASDAARATWLAPDRNPLPTVAPRRDR